MNKKGLNYIATKSIYQRSQILISISIKTVNQIAIESNSNSNRTMQLASFCCFTVNFELILHLALVFLMLTLCM